MPFHPIHRRFQLSLALCSMWLLSGAAGAVVGTASLSINHPGTQRHLTAEIWYEAEAGSAEQNVAIRPPLRSLRLAPAARPQASAPRPLIVLSHGNWGSRFSQGWLAMALVRAGYIVVSTSHPGTLGDDQTPAGRYRLWDRSADVSLTLDRLLADPAWRARIDARRIGFAGHSFGGWTGVSLAGGRFDPARQHAACESMPRRDLYCDSVLQDKVANIPADDAQRPRRDPRIRAYYLMASGPAQGFDPASLQAIETHFVFDSARHDEVLPAQAHSAALASAIPRARHILREAGHFSYVPLCRPLIGALLARAAGLPICNDPPGVDRAEVHRQVVHDAIDFFAGALPRP